MAKQGQTRPNKLGAAHQNALSLNGKLRKDTVQCANLHATQKRTPSTKKVPGGKNKTNAIK